MARDQGFVLNLFDVDEPMKIPKSSQCIASIENVGTQPELFDFFGD